MQSWLLLDLRGNQCIAGLLTVGEQGSPDWLSENTLYPYVSPSDRDARNVADLAFFRIGSEQRWRPALRVVLDDPALADAQRIHTLFDEPLDRLAGLLPVTLDVLIKASLNQFPVPILVLLDRAEVQALVQEFFSIGRREANVVIFSGSSLALAGFALWDVAEPAIPDAGRQWLCRVELDRQGQGDGRRTGAQPQHELRCYTWKRSRFAIKMLNSNPSTGTSLPTWRATELESVGAAMYALLWRDKLLNMLQVDVETLQKQLAEGERLLSRLKEMYDKLPTELGRPFARAERIRPE